MKFHFVDSHTASDPGSRRAIRRHVMKGKNLGRTIQGRGRKHAAVQEPKIFEGVEKKEKLEELVVARRERDVRVDSDGSTLIFPEIVPHDVLGSPSSPFAGEEYTYFAFPIQFTPSMRYMVYQFHTAVCDAIYPSFFCSRTEQVGSPWFKYMVSDQAFLHCLLAMVATYLNLFRKPDCEPLEATRHFSQTLRLINPKLMQPTPPQDSTIAIIISLAIHSKLIRDPPKCSMHLDGLQRLVDLRGGLSEISESNRALLHKILRTDIELAISLGARTRYGVGGLTAATPGPTAARILRYPLNQMCEPLRHMTREMLALCRQPGKAKMVALQYQDILIWLWQRLIDFAPLSEKRPLDPLDDIWHLSLLTFLATITWPTSFLRGLNCGLLQKLLRERIDSKALLERGDDYRALWFWIVFVYAMLLGEDNYDQLPVQHIREMAEELKVGTWEEVKVAFRPFPWIGILHDKTGRKLWDLIKD
ncbi:hypothetical protein CEP53_010881 [Fusarium sp. AF-6]|nr:hypothetical protein CEP53_010881 [Fusarium sp. AF-6]